MLTIIKKPDVEKIRTPLKPEQIAQELYEEVIEKYMSSEKKSRRAGFRLLSKEVLVTPILPKLSAFIKKETKTTLVCPGLEKLGMLLCMTKALLSNKSLLQNEIEELLPSVVTCLLISKLSETPGLEYPWMLRKYAANLLGEIVRSYNNENNSMQKRVEIVLTDALDGKKPLTTVYGGLIGLKKVNKEFAKLARPQIKEVKSRIEHFGTQTLEASQLVVGRIRKFLAEEGI